MSGRPLLPLEIGLLLISITSHLVGSSFGKIINENASCTGDLCPQLNNNNGGSPCAVWQSLLTPCSPGSAAGYQPTACACNVVSYNLGTACLLCQNQTSMNWREWAEEYGCGQNFVPSSLVYQPPSPGNIPKWAFKTLATPDASFDVEAAIQSTKSGWTPIQIALPIICAVAALLVAALAFCCWRRSKQSKLKPQRTRYWQDARLQGPRRFFGLFPDILRVRQQTVDTLWEIDDSARARDEAFTAPPKPSPTNPYDRPPEDASHSRTTSLSSLLPTSSRPDSSHSSSAFSNFLAKLTWSSPNGTATAKYKKGVAKAPEYKRVNVVADKPSARFKIDMEEGGLARSPLRNSFFSRMLPGERRNSQVSRATTLPSVLDIRMGPRSGDASSDQATTSGENVRGGSRYGLRQPPALYGTTEEDYESAQFSRPPRSDFTLTTNDLLTPTDGAFSGIPMSAGLGRPPSPSFSARADSDILPPTLAAPSSLTPLRPSHSAPHLTVPPLGKPNRR